MTKEKLAPTDSESKDIKLFIAKNWPAILGAGSAASAAVYLTAKFLIKKRQSNKNKYIRIDHLEELSEEVIAQRSSAHALLEEGQALAQTAGKQETSSAAQELAKNTDNPELAEALTTFSHTSKI